MPFPLTVNPLLALAVIVLSGVLAGQLAHRIKLPHVTGQIIIGVLIGSAGLHVFSTVTVDSLGVVTEFALGLIALTIGDHLNVARLRNAGRRLFLLLVTEATLTPAIVFFALLATGISEWTALLLAMMAVSTAPATVVALIKEHRARGVFVKTLSAAVALNNIACVALFEVARTISRRSLDPTLTGDLWALISGPLLQVGAALALGGLTGAVLVWATRHVVRTDRLVAASFVTLLLVAGVALTLGISVLLACLFLGVALANLTPNKEELGAGAFENIEAVIFAAFFTLAGMHLDFSLMVPAGITAAVLIGARFVGKYVAAGVAMKLAGATAKVRRYLGLALTPQAGVAVGLILLVRQDASLAPVQEIILAVGLTTVMVNEIVGSLLTHLALTRSGESGRGRPRLIDFLHEENIITNLSAATKEQAIAKLTDVLIETHHLQVDRKRLLESVLERERQASTCLGSGLAIPHGILEEGADMHGAMGISREGLDFDAPDGQPVHCMILLVTPPTQRDRHLEVLAALTRAIGRDANVQHQLYHARSPAHAYEAIYAEAAEGFNYYLTE